jgi:hypothetical protein
MMRLQLQFSYQSTKKYIALYANYINLIEWIHDDSWQLSPTEYPLILFRILGMYVQKAQPEHEFRTPGSIIQWLTKQ